jgi:hypothetical protein
MNTYRLPNDRAIAMPSLWYQRSVKCFRVGTGRRRMAKSMTMIRISTTLQNAVVLIHFAPGICRFHVASKGEQDVKASIIIEVLCKTRKEMRM